MSNQLSAIPAEMACLALFAIWAMNFLTEYLPAIPLAIVGSLCLKLQQPSQMLNGVVFPA